jgi:hypothetical protein
MQLDIFTRKGDWKQDLVLEKAGHGISFAFIHNCIAFRAFGSVLEPEPIGVKKLNIRRIPRDVS